nr:hypothetical protein [Aurantiacibacter marinus]
MKLMKHLLMAASAALVAAPAVLPGVAAAQDFPLVGGEYTSMTGITIEDGGGLAYANYLASEWARNQEFAKSNGWISDYRIYSNVDARDGEPDLYLMVTYPSVPDAAESERRGNEYRAWREMTDAQMEAAAGDRAEYRTVRGTMVLQEYTIR